MCFPLYIVSHSCSKEVSGSTHVHTKCANLVIIIEAFQDFTQCLVSGRLEELIRIDEGDPFVLFLVTLEAPFVEHDLHLRILSDNAFAELSLLLTRRTRVSRGWYVNVNADRGMPGYSYDESGGTEPSLFFG